MPGCVCIARSLYTTIQIAVLIETLKAPRSDICCWSCNIFYIQYRTVAAITNDESAAVFSWKGEILEEYWYCILNALICPEDDGKVHRPELIVDDRGDMTLV